MPSVFMSEQARALVLLHAAVAIVLIGSTTHHCLISLGYLRGSYKLRLGRIYAATIIGTRSSADIAPTLDVVGGASVARA